MCGIYGLVWREGGEGKRTLNIQVAEAMRLAIGARGPDGYGEIIEDQIVLGHLRLAIIDLAGGAQPMRSPDGQVALSYNGECYNFLELMPALSQRGWRFATRADTEVLLAGYCLDGEHFDSRLNGMYAYAILDRRTGPGVIQLGTDPVGIKPMFLYEDSEVSLFASELRALIAALRILGKPVGISSEGLGTYLRNGWTAAPLTMVNGARKLLPGERWAIPLDGQKPKMVSRRMRPASPPLLGSDADLDAELADRLKAIVTRQTISDVPLGFFLSGGVDSSLLLALAREQGLEAQSFTIGFVGEGHGVAASNEAEVAREVAKHLKSPHETIEVDASGLRQALPDAFAAMDQPLSDPACLPMLLLARFARRKVKVCLSGDGGDELFAGYPRHALAPWKRRWASLPAPLQTLGGRIASQLPKAPGSGPKEILRKARIAQSLVASPYYVDGPFAGMIAGSDDASWSRLRDADPQTLMDADIDGQLAGQMLPKTDNMTMFESLECRVPLLDLELIAFASSLSMRAKRSGSSGKLPLRRLLASYLPPEITNRPKHGFRVPLTSWFRGPMAQEIRDRLLGDLGQVHEFLPRAEVTRLVESHLSGQNEHSIRIWSLLAWDHWRRRALPGLN